MADDVKKSEVVSEQAEIDAKGPETITDTAESADRGSAQKKRRARKKPVKGESSAGGPTGEAQRESEAEGEKKRRVRKKRAKSDADIGQAEDDGIDIKKVHIKKADPHVQHEGTDVSEKAGTEEISAQTETAGVDLSDEKAPSSEQMKKKKRTKKTVGVSSDEVRTGKDERTPSRKVRAKKAAGEPAKKVRKKTAGEEPAQKDQAKTADGEPAKKVRKKRTGSTSARKVRAKTIDGAAKGFGTSKSSRADGPENQAEADTVGGKKGQFHFDLKGAGAACAAAVKKAVSNIPEKNRKKILGTAAAVLGVYFVLAFVFTFVFMPRTTLNGIGVSFKSYASASKMIKPTIKEYVLTVQNLDDSQDVVEGSAVHLKYDSMQWIKTALKIQNQFAWPIAIFKGNDITVEENISYDEDKFESILKKLSGFKTTTMIEPQDAHVAMDETGTYVVYPEVIGTTIDVDAAKAAARECLFTGDKLLDLEEYHILPKVYSDDEKLGQRLVEWNEYMKSAGLTYIFWDTPEVLTRDIIDSLITDDGDKLFVDEDKVMNLMAIWREKHDSIGRSFTFTTYEGIEVEIAPGGDYGYELNEEAVCADIIEKLTAHDTGSYEVSYWRKPLSKENNGLGGTYIEVSLTDQHMWMYENGELVIDTPVVTGMPTEEEDRITHKGCYSVDWHDEQVQVGTMETRGYEEFVDYWIAFNESEGIHDAQWRLDSEYTKEMYLYDGSHGCVNTPLAAMKVVYEHVIDGEAVVVY